MKVESLLYLLAPAVLAVCLLLVVLQYRKLSREYEALQASLQHLERLNERLRAARHDYLNQMQVAYGLLELEEYDELKAYLAPAFRELQKTGKALKTACPALNALLMAKMDEAEGAGIDCYVEVKSDLSGLTMKEWDLCRVVSNLIDNAIAALSQAEREKVLEIDISEDAEVYRIGVANSGPEIPDALRGRIFERGFSTKQGSGHGQGLAIVTELLSQAGGQVLLHSGPDRTQFTAVIRKGGIP